MSINLASNEVTIPGFIDKRTGKLDLSDLKDLLWVIIRKLNEHHTVVLEVIGAYKLKADILANLLYKLGIEKRERKNDRGELESIKKKIDGKNGKKYTIEVYQIILEKIPILKSR